MPGISKVKRAVIYFRVSSDDQVSNTSLGEQERVLREYCSKNNIVVDSAFSEDYSAKTFDRPKWNKMLLYLKRNHKQLDYLLFSDYSRYGRNTSQGMYYHDLLLKKYQVEPQSISQWLDYTIPEYIAILAMFLAAPDIENTRRRLRTISGMVARLKEGKWVSGRLPLGYAKDKNTGAIYQTSEAELILLSFEMIARGLSITEVKKRLARMGIDRSVKAWSKTFRNPFYKGVIINRLLPEPVQADINCPIITPSLFSKANAILSKNNGRITLEDRYPLKGFCSCGNCGGHLSGYSVKKKQLKSGYLTKKTPILYYICNQCRANHSLKKMHTTMMELITEYSINPVLLPVFNELIEANYQKLASKSKGFNSVIYARLKAVQKRIDSLNLKFIDGHISTEDYEAIKYKLINEKAELEAELKPEFNISNPKEKAKRTVQLLTNMAATWSEGNLSIKRRLQKCLFPSGLVYIKDLDTYRTPAVNGFLLQISAINGHISKKAVTSRLEDYDLMAFGSPTVTEIEPLLRDVYAILELAEAYG